MQYYNPYYIPVHLYPYYIPLLLGGSLVCLYTVHVCDMLFTTVKPLLVDTSHKWTPLLSGHHAGVLAKRLLLHLCTTSRKRTPPVSGRGHQN